MTSYQDFYRARRVMITGGLGFIGSNIARRLVELGADVLLMDSLIPDAGANFFNIHGIADKLRVNIADVRQESTMNHLVRDREVIFNLAGQVSHIDSMKDPYTDLEINCRSQLSILEACRKFNPAVKVVFAGTRQVYGKPDSLPVTEAHLVRPVDVNGINKAAGENYHLLYNNVFNVRACSLRLTNVYGPRQLIKHNRQGFIGWFIRLALEGREIEIFGDGSQIRDFVYVDDAADAFLRAGASDSCNGHVFNVGGSEPMAHKDLAALLVGRDRARDGVRNIEREGDTDPSVLEGRGIDGQDVGATARKCSFEDDDRSIFSMTGHDQDHWHVLSIDEGGIGWRVMPPARAPAARSC